MLYPFIPDYSTVQAELKKGCEALHPNISVKYLDLTSNYYDSTRPTMLAPPRPTSTNWTPYFLRTL